jgi:hypothetical protein
MPNVDLSYHDIDLICALLERAADTETAEAITKRLRAAQGAKSNPENPGNGVPDASYNYKRSSGI